MEQIENEEKTNNQLLEASETLCRLNSIITCLDCIIQQDVKVEDSDLVKMSSILVNTFEKYSKQVNEIKKIFNI